jgi:hypothetical protein
MRHPGAVLLLLLLAGVSSGCEGFKLFVSTGPLPDSHQSPTASPPRAIGLGDIVNGTFAAPEASFDLLAPRTGTLFIRIVWDRRHGDLHLAFLSTVFSTTTSHDASRTGTISVAQGQRYRITVVGDSDRVPFMLTTSMDSP